MKNATSREVGAESLLSSSAHSAGSTTLSSQAKQKFKDKQEKILGLVPYLKFREGQELCSSESRTKMSFRLTNCQGCLIMLVAFLALAIASFNRFMALGQRMEMQYKESSNLFVGNVTLQEDVFYGFTALMVLDSYPTRNRTFFDSLTGDEGEPMAIDSETDYERVVCSLLAMNINYKDEGNNDCYIPTKCFSAMGSGLSIFVLGHHRAATQRIYAREIQGDFREYPIMPMPEWSSCSPNSLTFNATNQGFQFTQLQFQTHPGFEYTIRQLEVKYIGEEETNLLTFVNETLRGTSVEQTDLDFQMSIPIDLFILENYLPPSATLVDRLFFCVPFLRSHRQVRTKLSIPYIRLEVPFTHIGVGSHVRFTPTIEVMIALGYPPEAIQRTIYYSFDSFISQIGGYLSLIKLAVEIAAGFFIFGALNRHMARTLASDDQLQERPLSQREREIARIEKEFRTKVSLEGIYEARKRVEALREEIKLLREEIGDLRNLRSSIN